MMPNSLAGKRFLVTGGGGFIGSHLVRLLLKSGCEAVVLEPTGVMPWRMAGIPDAFSLYAADVADSKAVAEIMAQVRPDGIFHLAAYGVDSADQDIQEALRVNVLGIVSVLEAMRQTGCRRIVAMGSGAEYGSCEGLIDETTVLRPRSIYGSAKAAATVIAHQWAGQHDIGIVTLRPFGVYGDAEPRHKLFCHVILSLLDGEDVALTPCGQCRDYCHAADVAAALAACMADVSVNGQVFNVGSGELRPIRQYVERIRSMIDSPGRVLYGALPYRKDEVWTPAPDIRRIREHIGWQPVIGLQQGLERTVAWYRANRHLYASAPSTTPLS